MIAQLPGKKKRHSKGRSSRLKPLWFEPLEDRIVLDAAYDGYLSQVASLDDQFNSAVNTAGAAYGSAISAASTTYQSATESAADSYR